MNIRKFCRLGYLTVASLFWASCSESNPQIPTPLDPASNTSSDVSSSGEESSSSAAPESSSEISSESGSSEVELSQSSSDETSSSSHSSSSMASSSSSNPIYALARWEEKLESCEAISEDSGTLYGVGPCASTRMKYVMNCSNDSSYSHYQVDQKLVYTSIQEYNVAHGIVPEDLVESCPQGDYALFVDVLADVQKVLYEKWAKRLEEDSALTDEAKMYLEGLLDHANKALNSSLAPYLPNGIDLYNPRMYGFEMKRASKHWFNGYIAKTETCENAFSVTTETYQQKYDAILAECNEIIENKLKTPSSEEKPVDWLY